MVNNRHLPREDRSKKPHSKLAELTAHLQGKWRVTGQDINGEAEYKPVNHGFLLVQTVDFMVNGIKMKVMQHIAYDQSTDTLQAHYMDSMGANSVYTWELKGQIMRVSQGDKTSDIYFEAAFNQANSQYSGTWHYGSSQDVEDTPITYTKISSKG